MKFSRQEYWSGLPFPSPGDLPNPGTKAGSPSLQADYLFSELQGKPILKILANYMIDTVERKMQCFKEASFSFDRHLKVKVTQSCPTLCDPMDYTVHGFLQARILEWVAFPFSRKSWQSRDRTRVSRIAGSLPAEPPGCVCAVCKVASVTSDSLQPYELQPARLLFPWDSPGKNTGVGCHALLQGILPTQGWKLCLLGILHCRPDSLPLRHRGSPFKSSFKDPW